MDKVVWGHIDPWWNNDFKTLNYHYKPTNFTPEDFDRWKTQGYDRFNLNGAMYDMSNPMPSYTQGFIKLHNWNNVGVTYFCMKSMDFLPAHQDHYTVYIKKFNIQDPSTVWRSIVFLEDWKPGHYFEINGIANTSWKAGDWVKWQYDISHTAGNIGLDNRYTAQITGWTD